MVGLNNAQEAVASLLENAKNEWNEAQTRFQLIDETLKALGWTKADQAVETHENGNYTDYELGRPRCAVVEAKKVGKYFDIEVGQKRSRRLRDVIGLDKELEKTFDQCWLYCFKRGIPIGICTNGTQYVIFASSRSDGVSPLDGNCIVFYSADDILKNFAEFWKLLSPDALAHGRTLSELRKSFPQELPAKLSTTIPNFGNKRYRSRQQDTLRSIGQIILEDVPTTKDAELEFLKRCYCRPGAISKYSLVTDNVLRTRYKGVAAGHAPLTTQVDSDKPVILTNEVWNEAVTQRPVVVLGDAGVGKTTFIRNLMLVDSPSTDDIYIHIDLGFDATFGESIDKFILDQIDEQLRNQHNIDINEKDFVTGAWNLDIQRFKEGIHRELFQRSPEEADQKLLDFLEARIADKKEHIKKSIHHIVAGRNKRVVIVLDNADQRNFQIQEDVYLKAQEIARQWRALVFVSLRPLTYYRSKRIGAASAYSNRVFTVFPPKADEVLAKRIDFAVDVVEGRIPLPNSTTNLQIETVSLVLQAMWASPLTPSFLAEGRAGRPPRARL